MNGWTFFPNPHKRGKKPPEPPVELLTVPSRPVSWDNLLFTGNTDRGWNDPPIFDYQGASSFVTGSAQHTKLNKRAAYPMSSNSTAPVGMCVCVCVWLGVSVCTVIYHMTVLCMCTCMRACVRVCVCVYSNLSYGFVCLYLLAFVLRVHSVGETHCNHLALCCAVCICTHLASILCVQYWEGTYYTRRKSGDIIPYHCRVTPVLGPGGWVHLFTQ